jgi:glycerol-3-phosphate dehydrogenase (NAD(P)+)
VLSCTSTKSRNYALGHALGAAAQAQETLEHPPALVEGVATAAAVARLGAAHAVDLPIAAAVDAIVHSGAAVDAEIERLLTRPLRAEGP